MESSPLTIHLHSFGYKYGGPPADEGGNGGGFVFDCRALPNPFWEESLRHLAGTEPPIVAFMERAPDVQAFAEHAGWLVLNAGRAYAARGYTRLMASFGCTGGRHRSVYLAERVRALLEREGFRVVVSHRDAHRAEELAHAHAVTAANGGAGGQSGGGAP
ncbi:MAG: ATP-binding protein [Candidatus Lambdaproteobacteria bacterium]|nr:ATP-binding protein [Candidatus Lambdaproteobacteria bacterium]